VKGPRRKTRNSKPKGWRQRKELGARMKKIEKLALGTVPKYHEEGHRRNSRKRLTRQAKRRAIGKRKVSGESLGPHITQRGTINTMLKKSKANTKDGNEKKKKKIEANASSQKEGQKGHIH